MALTQPRIRRGRAWQQQVVLLDVRRTADPARVLSPQSGGGPTSGRTISPTSSIPRAAPARPRASPSPTAPPATRWPISTSASRSVRRIACCGCPPSSSTCRSSICSAFWAPAGSVVIPPADGHQQTARAGPRRFERHGVTLWNSVPAIAELHAGGRAERAAEARWQACRLIMTERRLDPDRAARATAGRASRTARSTAWAARPKRPSGRSSIRSSASSRSGYRSPMARPLRNQTLPCAQGRSLALPDPHHRPLFIGGAGLALGYWRIRHRPLPASSHPATGERLYDTGDLGRYRRDGTIEFLGREDHRSNCAASASNSAKSRPPSPATPRSTPPPPSSPATPTHRRLVAYVVPRNRSTVAAGASISIQPTGLRLLWAAGRRRPVRLSSFPALTSRYA